MTGYLLDTNVLSELFKSVPNDRVVRFVSSLKLEAMYISTVTLAEIRYGIAECPNLDRRSKLIGWLTQNIRPMFEGRVLPITEDVMFRWRIVVESGRKSGHTYSQPDLIIAATALENGLIVVTRNTGDFVHSGIKVTNPWLE